MTSLIVIRHDETAWQPNNRIAAAIDMQTQATDLAPEEPSFRMQLARLHQQGGDRVKARTELETFSELGRKYPREAERLKLLKTISG